MGDGDKGVALLKKRLYDGGQSLWGVQGGVVKQNNGAGLYLGGHPLGDLSGGQIFPVQTVAACSKGKGLGDNAPPPGCKCSARNRKTPMLFGEAWAFSFEGKREKKS